jgi:hypothetical protein
LEHPRVRALATHIPRFVPGQPVPVVALPGLSGQVSGYWSLWRIALQRVEGQHHRIMPLFVHDDGRVLQPTARRIWDQLLVVECVILSHIKGSDSQALLSGAMEIAETHGLPIYQELLESHNAQLVRKREKAAFAFSMRRQALGRIGLAEVRNHRLTLLAQEETKKWAELTAQAKAIPEMTPLLLIRLEGEKNHG